MATVSRDEYGRVVVNADCRHEVIINFGGTKFALLPKAIEGEAFLTVTREDGKQAVIVTERLNHLGAVLIKRSS